MGTLTFTANDDAIGETIRVKTNQKKGFNFFYSEIRKSFLAIIPILQEQHIINKNNQIIITYAGDFQNVFDEIFKKISLAPALVLEGKNFALNRSYLL